MTELYRIAINDRRCPNQDFVVSANDGQDIITLEYRNDNDAKQMWSLETVFVPNLYSGIVLVSEYNGMSPHYVENEKPLSMNKWDPDQHDTSYVWVVVPSDTEGDYRGCSMLFRPWLDHVWDASGDDGCHPGCVIQSWDKRGNNNQWFRFERI